MAGKISSVASMRFAPDGKATESLEPAEESDDRDDPAGRQQFVVLLRHGVAEERSDDKPDSDRSLTKEGVQKMKKISRGLAELLPDADVIVSSPLVRCVQTALWVAKAYDQKVEIRTADELIPGSGARGYRSVLSRIQVERAIVVGHEPDLTECMRNLLGLRSRADLQLRKGGAYGLDVAAGDATLRWMLTPRILRKLG